MSPAVIGSLAAVLGTLCWLPQLAKTLRTREVRDLSLWTNVLLLATATLWFSYGVMMGDWPIILANLFAGACVATLIVAKLVWGKK